MDEAIDTVIEGGHSRIPVYEETIDEIVGILYAKDLLPFLKGSVGERPSLRSLLRTPVFVPESMSVDDLLHEFQRRKVHIAIVLDEYGGTAGLVTIEDLLEEIVGEIQDEYDEEEPLIVRLSDDEARIDGRADVDDLAELFDIDLGLEDADEYDTVGGLIYHRIGGVPKPGDQVVVDGLTLTVETTDGRRVGKVLVVRDARRRPAVGRRGGPLGPVPPVGHPLRFTVIAHGDRRVLGPMSAERLDTVVARTPLTRDDHVLDLGCGKGDFLTRLLARWPESTAEGFDRNPWFLRDARAIAESAGVARRVSFVETDAPGALISDRSVAIAVAMGAAGIVGDHAATVAGLARAVQPGGVVVFADGIWNREPPVSGLASFGMTRDELPDGPEGFAALGVAAGLDVLEVDVVDDTEWDAYEDAYAGAVERWAAANPADPDAEPFLERARLFRSSFAEWRRDAMGFAVARFRVPDQIRRDGR